MQSRKRSVPAMAKRAWVDCATPKRPPTTRCTARPRSGSKTCSSKWIASGATPGHKARRLGVLASCAEQISRVLIRLRSNHQHIAAQGAQKHLNVLQVFFQRCDLRLLKLGASVGRFCEDDCTAATLGDSAQTILKATDKSLVEIGDKGDCLRPVIRLFALLIGGKVCLRRS